MLLSRGSLRRRAAEPFGGTRASAGARRRSFGGTFRSHARQQLTWGLKRYNLTRRVTSAESAVMGSRRGRGVGPSRFSRRGADAISRAITPHPSLEARSPTNPEGATLCFANRPCGQRRWGCTLAIGGHEDRQGWALRPKGDHWPPLADRSRSRFHHVTIRRECCGAVGPEVAPPR